MMVAETHHDPIGPAEIFVDERGAGLRATWHPEDGVVVMSMWRDGTCIGSFQLSSADTARLSSLLTQAWVDGLRHSLEH